MAKRTDLLVQGEGSIYLLRAPSRRGQRWVDEHRLRVRRDFSAHRGVMPSSTVPRSDIAGADDALVPREIKSSDPARWAEHNRKFNAIFTRSR